MKKNIKALLSITLGMSALFTSSFKFVKASEIEDVPQQTVNYFDIDFEYKQPTKYVVDGVDIYTYKEFASSDDAISLFISQYKEEYEQFKKIHNLPDLDLNTYNEYKKYLYTSDDTSDFDSVFEIFSSELDVYNSNLDLTSAINKALVDPSVETYLAVDLLSRVDNDKIMDKYPDLKNYVYNSEISTCTVGGYNISSAVSYASTYATSPNTAYTYYQYDCTNFVSQILRAGGIATDGTWYPYSSTWVNANTLMNYLGSRYGKNYSSTSHYAFSNVINTGDVIVLAAVTNPK